MLRLTLILVSLNLLGVTLINAQSKPSPTPATTAKPNSATAGLVATTSGTPLQIKSGDPFNLTFVIAGKDLPNKSKSSKVDPYVKVFHRQGSTQEGSDWTEFGITDKLKDDDNPTWNNVFWFIWKKGTNQVWHFEVKDHDTLNRDDAVGQLDIDVDKYVERGQELTEKLSDGGSLTIKKTTPVNFRLYARNLAKMDQFGGLSDPYVESYWRRGKEGADILIGTTSTIDNVENADWDQTFEFSNYQKGTDQYWHFKVKDSDSVSGDDDLGDVLVEVDPFIQKRAAKVNKLSSDPANKGTLTVTPA